jgi:hypothetical protein
MSEAQLLGYMTSSQGIVTCYHYHLQAESTHLYMVLAYWQVKPLGYELSHIILNFS